MDAKVEKLKKDGEAFADAGNYEKAIECYDKALAIDPEDINAFYLKGYALYQLKQYLEAIECYDKALSIDPEDTWALSFKGYALYVLEQYAEAIECFDKVLSIDPEDTWALGLNGHLLSKLKQYAEAIKSFDKALAIDSKDKITLRSKGYALIELKRFAEALEYLDKALAIDPEFKEALFLKGIALDKTENYQAAATIFYKGGSSPLLLLADYPSVSEPTLLLDNYFNQLVPEHTEHREIYGKIYLQSIRTVALLHVDGGNEEGEVAHYTSKVAARCMLFGDPHQPSPSTNGVSPLRLCSVSGANDPSEGKVLYQYLGLREDAPNRHTHQAFVCCFTFDHDCLNQFRLYGKEAGREATGLSLVLRSQYFNRKPSLNIPLSPSVGMKMGDGTTADAVQTSKVKQASDPASNRHALFRCIYIDPHTNQVVSLGRREEYAFYRERDIDGTSTQKKVDEVDGVIKHYLKQYTTTLTEVKKSIAELRKTIRQQGKVLDEGIVRGLLLHLRYLVKDVAFMEERECRMVSIEKLHEGNSKVQHDKGMDKLYIKADPIGNHLERIYFAPKSDDIGQFRDKLAHKGINVECRQSKHPYN